MNALSRDLREMAVTHRLAFLVTNHMVTSGKTNYSVTRAALGESWHGVPHTRLLFHRNNESSTINVTLVKCTDSPHLVLVILFICTNAFQCGTCVNATICDAGFC